MFSFVSFSLPHYTFPSPPSFLFTQENLSIFLSLRHPSMSFLASSLFLASLWPWTISWSCFVQSLRFNYECVYLVFIIPGYLTQDFFLYIYLQISACHCFWPLSSNLMYKYTTFSFLNHILFIHSWVEGPLGCYQVLAITNNVTMNIVEQMFL